MLGNSKGLVTLVLASMFMLTVLSVAVFADGETLPEGAESVTIDATSRRAAAQASSIEAIAGNVTQLTIQGTTVTQGWQGYYGNVTGTITLDDSNNNTMYDWVLANPEGEVFATENDSINWTQGSVDCYNWTGDEAGDASYYNVSAYEVDRNWVPTDVDGVNDTFTYQANTTYISFWVGSHLVNKTCPYTQTYNGSEVKDTSTGNFSEVILYDLSTDALIFTTKIVESGPIGFNDLPWDFQMLVPEDGHNGDTLTTTYYFYVELE